MNNSRRGIERFEEDFRLNRQTLSHDFRNGLTVRLTNYATAGPAGTTQSVGGEAWGKRCFWMEYSEVIFTFEAPVSKVEFSVLLSQEHEGSWYRINEVGVPDSDTIPIPANGGGIVMPKIVMFDSTLGIESFVISHVNNDQERLYVDNLFWE
ncbi:hypothetical protein D3C85_1049810 [compost metagenome]